MYAGDWKEMFPIGTHDPAKLKTLLTQKSAASKGGRNGFAKMAAEKKTDRSTGRVDSSSSEEIVGAKVGRLVVMKVERRMEVKVARIVVVKVVRVDMTESKVVTAILFWWARKRSVLRLMSRNSTAACSTQTSLLSIGSLCTAWKISPVI